MYNFLRECVILRRTKTKYMQFKSILITMGMLSALGLTAQDMNGYRTDNYNGVNGAFFNPANLASSPYRIDVNIFGLNLFAGNENAAFSFKTLSDIPNDSSSLNALMGNNKTNDILINLSMHLPSVSVRISPKTTVALLTRSRLLAGIHDFDGALLNSINGQIQDLTLPFTINNSTNMRNNVNMYTEIGVSAGHTLLDFGAHRLKVGATLKYLGGVGNYYIQVNQLKASVDYDSVRDEAYIYDGSGSLSISGGGLDISNTDKINFKMKSGGLGADFGIAYEFRPNSNDDDPLGYLVKFNAAILDLGRIKYETNKNIATGYDIHIPAGERFYLGVFDGKSGEEIKATLDTMTRYFTKNNSVSTGDYSVSLPTTLQLGGDVRAFNHLYCAVNLQLAMSSNKTKAYNPGVVNSLTITPRYETRIFAAYLPIQYSNLSKTTIGIGLRAGPLYIGSSSAVSMALNSSKQADFYLGLRVGIKTPKQKKAE